MPLGMPKSSKSMPLGMPSRMCTQPMCTQEVKAAASNATRAHVLLVQASLNPENRQTTELAAEKVASHWLTCRPLKRIVFNLTKLEFQDGIHLPYNWRLQNLPSLCTCGSQFTISHTLSYPFIQHNKIRDLMAGFLKRVAINFPAEPHPKPSTGEYLHLHCMNRYLGQSG